jgi:hypothetical protein
VRHKSLYYDCHSCPDFHRDKLQQESRKTEPWLRRSGFAQAGWMPHQVRHDMPTKSKEALDAEQ